MRWTLSLVTPPSLEYTVALCDKPKSATTVSTMTTDKNRKYRPRPSGSSTRASTKRSALPMTNTASRETARQSHNVRLDVTIPASSRVSSESHACQRYAQRDSRTLQNHKCSAAISEALSLLYSSATNLNS